ncbi:hypothetical protein EMPS_00059 [Entomortierella parvispora]|uniref:Uncharacterized protein n=1 Tax=Entomortierella parvispora TaxID=205924 RepID=A0A9P3GYZ5_9FUNG|nr:hypothetical protein EMPS_00059 [Entomortierella parvispora]
MLGQNIEHMKLRRIPKEKTYTCADEETPAEEGGALGPMKCGEKTAIVIDFLNAGGVDGETRTTCLHQQKVIDAINDTISGSRHEQQEIRPSPMMSAFRPSNYKM